MGFKIRSLEQPLKDPPIFIGFKIQSLGQPAKDPPIFMGFNMRSLKQLVMDNGTPILMRFENTAFLLCCEKIFRDIL